MSEDDQSAPEPSREEMLDNTPEAVAMRRARAARAEAVAREAQAPAPKDRRALRRRVILVGALGGMAAVQLLGRLAAGPGGR